MLKGRYAGLEGCVKKRRPTGETGRSGCFSEVGGNRIRLDATVELLPIPSNELGCFGFVTPESMEGILDHDLLASLPGRAAGSRLMIEVKSLLSRAISKDFGFAVV